MKSNRNKTIDFEVEGNEHLLKNVITLTELTEIENLENKLILGDSIEQLSFIPNNSIDLIIIDPPYNLNKEFNKFSFKKTSQLEYEEYIEQWLLILKDKLKEEGTIYVCCDWFSSLTIGPLINKHFILRNRITWKRDKGRGSETNYKNNSEDIWFATKSNKYTFNWKSIQRLKENVVPYKDTNGQNKDWFIGKDGKPARYTKESNLWSDIVIPFWSMAENTAHPTQKPEKLIERLILASSNKDDIVLDCFLGSGTTAVCAKKLNRKFIGIELDEKYLSWTQYRLNRLDG